MNDVAVQPEAEPEQPHPLLAFHAFGERLPLQERRLAAVLAKTAPGPVAEELIELHRTVTELSKLMYAVCYTLASDIEDLGDDVDEVAEATEADDAEGLSFEDGKNFAEIFGILLSMLQEAQKQAGRRAPPEVAQLIARVEAAIHRASELTMPPDEPDEAEAASP